MKAECFWCEKEFEYNDDKDVDSYQDLGYDEHDNDIWIIKEFVVCPFCGESTIVFEY